MIGTQQYRFSSIQYTMHVSGCVCFFFMSHNAPLLVRAKQSNYSLLTRRVSFVHTIPLKFFVASSSESPMTSSLSPGVWCDSTHQNWHIIRSYVYMASTHCCKSPYTKLSYQLKNAGILYHLLLLEGWIYLDIHDNSCKKINGNNTWRWVNESCSQKDLFCKIMFIFHLGLQS